MAILTHSGRVAMAQSIAIRPIHLAWGSGDANWDTVPVPEPPLATSLLAELGRRSATFVEYLVADAGGALTLGGERFAVSVHPTNLLHMRFDFEFTEAAGADIRELGVFVGTETQTGLPPGQAYFTPGEITNPGTLLALERIPKIVRLITVRQNFDYVIKI